MNTSSQQDIVRSNTKENSFTSSQQCPGLCDIQYGLLLIKPIVRLLKLPEYETAKLTFDVAKTNIAAIENEQQDDGDEENKLERAKRWIDKGHPLGESF